MGRRTHDLHCDALIEDNAVETEELAPFPDIPAETPGVDLASNQPTPGVEINLNQPAIVPDDEPSKEER